MARMHQDRIGIALSSGGAGSLAQIGILEELAAAGLTIDCVAGTSGGAIVGAAFASGKLGELRDAVCSMTRSRVFSKILFPIWPRLAVFDSRPPMEFVRPYVGERIEDLAKAFAAVAVDLKTGAEIVLRRGSVLEALRASTAIPGLFSPCRHQGRWLADGALVNPLPVNVARALGGSFVIAVNVFTSAGNGDHLPIEGWGDRRALISSSLTRWLQRFRQPASCEDDTAPLPAAGADEKQLKLLAILSRASRIVQSHIAKARLQVEPPDFLINVPVGEVGVFEFHRARRTIEARRAAARNAMPELLAALVSRSEPSFRRMLRWWDNRSRTDAPTVSALARAS
jgi:NTE family protein